MKGIKELPSVEYLEECVDYNPDTGLFFWKTRPISHFSEGKKSAKWRCSHWNKRFASKKAGCLGKDGYLAIGLDSQIYRSHRLAWKMAHGVDPTKTIDHINRDPLDNRIANLRDVCMLEQSYNSSRNNELPRGVSLVPKSDRYAARVYEISLATYETVEEAAEVAKYGYEYMAFMKNSGYQLPEGNTNPFKEETELSVVKSKFTGVQPTKNGTFAAKGRSRGRSIHLGTYKCPLEAAKKVERWKLFVESTKQKRIRTMGNHSS